MMFDWIRQAKRLRPSATLLTGLVSVTLGAVGVAMSRHYLDAQVLRMEAAYAVPDEAMVSLVVPSRGLQAGEVLTRADLAIRPVPIQYADSRAINEHGADAAIGRRMSFAADAGRPLLWAHLDAPKSAVFSGRVPAGLRAMTVRVDEINAISGFLQPGDHIDLLLTLGAGGQQGTLPLIANLSVIATGVQTLASAPADTAQRHFTTITVEVRPVDAQRITLAQQVGRLTAVLRNPSDRKVQAQQRITLSDLLGEPVVSSPPVEAPATGKPAPQPVALPQIEYIIGGT